MIKRTALKTIRTVTATPKSSVAPLLVQRQPLWCRRRPEARPIFNAISRCYSATVETNHTNASQEKSSVETGNEAAQASEGGAPAGAREADQSKKELEEKNKEVIDLKDKYLRSVADFRNLQERTRREVQAARDFALQRFATDLIESIDNLDLALATVPPEKLDAAKNASPHQDLVNLHSGLRMTERVLMQTLKKHGLERFDPTEEGAMFDPNKHEAMFQAPQQGKEDGLVFHTQQKGFLLNGRVLRAAKVGVVKNS